MMEYDNTWRMNYDNAWNKYRDEHRRIDEKYAPVLSGLEAMQNRLTNLRMDVAKCAATDEVEASLGRVEALLAMIEGYSRNVYLPMWEAKRQEELAAGRELENAVHPNRVMWLLGACDVVDPHTNAVLASYKEDE